MNLRPYQVSGMALIQESFRKGHKRIVRCAPTGSGKSVEMAYMTARAYEKGRRVILLTHRMELFKSTLAHLGRSGIPCVELNAGADIPSGDWRVMLAMEKTLWNRIQKGDTILPPSMLIADEIHFQNFTKIIDHFAESYLIGFSATPQGKHIHKIYTDIVNNIDIPDLIEGGFLTPCKAYQMIDDLSDVKVKGEEFEDKSLFAHYNKAKLYEGIIDEYKAKCLGQKGIVFCVNIEHTVRTYEAFKAAGVNAFFVHSGSKEFKMSEEERVRQVKEFEASYDGVMINSGILTTGYDHAAIMWVGVLRATLSLALWLQMCGRGSRIIPKPDGSADRIAKPQFTILDFGMNHNRLGLWNQPRTWSIKEPKKKKKLQAAPVKTCPSCGAMLYATIRVCEYCQYQFPKPTHDLCEGIMVEVDTTIPLGLIGKRISELSIPELISCQTTGKLKSSYVWRVIRTKEANRYIKNCPECGGSSSFLSKDGISCTCHLGLAPCSYCEKHCEFCNDEGFVRKTPEELAATPEYLDEYYAAKGYKNGWLWNEQTKIEQGEVGYKDYILR